MEILNILLLLALIAVIALQFTLLKRQQNASGQEALQKMQQALILLTQGSERSEREVRAEVQQAALATRQETAANLGQFQKALTEQMGSIAALQSQQLEAFSRQLLNLNEILRAQFDTMRASLGESATLARQEQAQALKQLADSLQQALATLTESNAQRMSEVRATLEEKLRHLQADNASKLEEMRKTVDEKLHATLEQRLGESFKLVSERLEKVHQGLGEMQQLAIGVGDLKRVLGNVKTRGTWGEVQLEMLLEQVLTADQYGKNIETIPGSGARVEFAIRLPGHDKSNLDKPVWLPLDAKFPKEQYERLVDAAERADALGVEAASKELEQAVRREAKTIAEKYLAPPLTTDFAILFLPTEGLYAEVMRRPGLADDIQRLQRVCIAGPATLSALLNSLQMGFRTLAMEKRSSEVWQVLGAAKTEFSKFGEVLAATKTTLERAAQNIEKAEVRTRQMSRKLKSVEALPGEEAQVVLGVELEE